VEVKLTTSQLKSVQEYCKLNNIEDIDKFISKCFTEGYNINKYGLLGGDSEKIGGIEEKLVEIEVIREIRVEVPVEVIKEVVKYVEVPVEIIKEVEVIQYVDREVIKEVPVEIIKEKIVNVIQEVVPNIMEKRDEYVTNIDKICDKPEPIIIEKIVEVIKEVIVEKEVIKEVIIEGNDSKLKPKLEALQNTVQKLKLDNIEKDRLIKEYEKTIQDIQKFNEGTKAMYLKGSNLDNKL